MRDRVRNVESIKTYVLMNLCSGIVIDVRRSKQRIQQGSRESTKERSIESVRRRSRAGETESDFA